ncbi:MAG: OmpA family protein, partial [Moorella sp. (in: Bacteria)]|nr:OmpA family protein [Moorella sp. (in: firmicutes)]
NLGDAHERLGKPARAFFYYREAVRTRPDLAIAYAGAANLYAALGDAYSAYVLYEKARRHGYPEDKLRERRDRAARQWPRDLVVYFGKNRADLDAAARERLELLVEACKEDGRGVSLVIEGFTCDLGSRRYNNELSRRRALAVARYLGERLGSRVVGSKVVAHGEEHRAVPEADETARILNRRVRIRVFEGQMASARP